MVASTTVNNGSNVKTAGGSSSKQPAKKVIDQATRELIDRLLLERISLAGIARAAQVSEQWLLSLRQREIRVGAPDRLGDTQKKGRLTIQCDELWSFVGNKGNKQWVWLALDADTREIVGVTIGARDEASANKLWESLPPLYRQCAIAYTEFWAAYGAVLPSKRHRAVGKETGSHQLPKSASTTP